MIEVSLNNIQKYYGATQILEDISFEAKTGERIGIIGKNGCGKTTIFKIISGLENHDGGNLSFRKGAKVGYLDQLPEYDTSYRVIDVLMDAFASLNKIRARLNSLEEELSKGGDVSHLMKEYGTLQESYTQEGGYDIEEKVSKITTGLNILGEFKDTLFNNLSGGEKTRVILAKLLLQEPNILLLDEPSNHLDIESMEWLESYLKNYNGTVLIISHDRYFLDSVITRIVEVRDKIYELYEGNYSYYLVEKKRRFEEQLKLYEAQQKKIKSMEEAIKRFRDWGNRGDNKCMFIKAENMQKRINKMDKVDRPNSNNKRARIDFTNNERSGKDVINIENLYKAYDSKVLFKAANFTVKYQERIALLGGNGSGKTTLLNILLGKSKADRGDLRLGSNTQIAYLDQNITFDDENQTVLETLQFEHMLSEGNARNILASFLFYGEDVYKSVKTLSGGERSRLKLCLLIQKDINLLILDEPTNHLDIESREILENALLNFDGTILFVSHDRYFINKIADSISEIDNYVIKKYIGDYEYYRDEKLKSKVITDVPSPIKKNKVNKQKDEASNTLNKNNDYKRSFIEKDIEKYECKLAETNAEIELNSDDYLKLKDLLEEKAKLEDELELLFDKWCNA